MTEQQRIAGGMKRLWQLCEIIDDNTVLHVQCLVKNSPEGIAPFMKTQFANNFAGKTHRCKTTLVVGRRPQ
ncbi:MAG: hypothetical protein GY820_35195 [Gammaproteobacteria bacterium]|nr:hypothetical protein [Gammaproteobacteria bacterium]